MRGGEAGLLARRARPLGGEGFAGFLVADEPTLMAVAEARKLGCAYVVDAVHIHRSSDWFDSEHLPIPRAEWDVYVEQHDDLVPCEDDAVLWSGHPEGLEVVLDWFDGRITVHQADETTLALLATIADDLHGVLQGDDCEVYGGDGSLLEQDLPDPVISAIPLPEPEPGGGATSRGEFLRSLLRRE